MIDALESSRKIQAFTEGQTFADFSSSELVRSAVERPFEIIGEALGKAMTMEPALELRSPEWRKIVGLRNRLIHGYDSVDDEIIWDIFNPNSSPPLPTLSRGCRARGTIPGTSKGKRTRDFELQGQERVVSRRG